jgi:hypothetical protein
MRRKCYHFTWFLAGTRILLMRFEVLSLEQYMKCTNFVQCLTDKFRVDSLSKKFDLLSFSKFQPHKVGMWCR